MSERLSPERITITAALPYTNGPIHIGHLAGVYVPADIFARYSRLQGNDVAFICGSDEHGVAIPMKAAKEGIQPEELIDKYHTIIKQSFEEFGITFDNYSRTSAQIHHDTASGFFTQLHEHDVFEEEVSAQLYDAEADQFLADRFVTGTCPKCGYEEAYGDQCENCGSSLNATDLIQPRSTISGAKPSLKETRHWYLPLDRFESFLTDWILKGHKKDWKPNVYGQCKSWIDDGLKPRAVTRDLDWGIPVPLKEAAGKVLYVWFDAPIGYISSTKEWAEKKGIDWRPYWKDPSTRLYHFIGKDNIVFHCIIFPCMLKAHGDYILPENVPANEFLNLEGNKLSTSRNWAVWLHEYLEEFPDMQDTLRYTLTANAPETKDNDFTWKDFQARNNNELVAIYGNFVNRVVVLTQKYFEGKVPQRHELQQEDKEVLAAMKAFPSKISNSINKFRFREAVQELINLARIGNKYLAEQEPWKVIKEDDERVATIMHIALQLTAGLSVLSEPFLPFTTEKLQAMLNWGTLDHSWQWDEVSEADQLLPVDHELGEPILLFRKIEDAEVVKQLEKLEATRWENEQSNADIMPQKDTIDFEDFSKIDLRIGTILEAEKMPKTKKLMVLKVDTGLDTRTIVSGIAEDFEPAAIVGKRVTVVVNLAPRPLRGVTSEGMILMTQNTSGKLVFVNPDEADIGDGETIN